LGFHSPFVDPLSGGPTDLTRQYLVSSLSLPVGTETAEGIYIPISLSVIPSFPDSFITYEVNGWQPNGTYVISEEGLFPVVPWDATHQTEENMVLISNYLLQLL
jgi:hypothetical protein